MSDKQTEIDLNLELFIARRMLRGKEAGSVSVPIVRIAVAGIVLGICVMLISLFIITGFKQEITTKLSGFVDHLNITSYDNNESYAGSAIVVSDSVQALLKEIEGVEQVYAYVTKPAILKSDTEIHGVVLKGVDSLYDSRFYKRHLKAGDFPALSGSSASNEILLSESIANLLNVKVGDKLTAHFVQDPPRVRVFVVQGVYDTGFQEYDDLMVLGDIRHLQRLNSWTSDQVSGYGMDLADLKNLHETKNKVMDVLPLDEQGDFYKVTTLRETAPQIFDWLDLLNMNFAVILVLIVIVAGVNMVSGLLIFILDKTNLIGILKALGCRNLALKKLFLYVAMRLIVKGMLVGNLLAFLLGGIQYYFRIIQLDPKTYYMDTVPISFEWGFILLLNVGVFIVSVAMLIVPAMLISKINPIKAIRFE